MSGSDVSRNYFPFFCLGFRSNPFRALTGEEWAGIAVLPETVAAALTQSEKHLQILGAAGRGKTTALRAIQAREKTEGRAAAYEYLPLGKRRFSTLVRGLGLFCLDEAQRLDAWERRRLVRTAAAREAARLVLAGHEDLTPLFAKHRIPLTTVRLDTVSVAHIQQLLEKRLDFFALSPPPSSPRVTFRADALEWLCDVFGSDLRAAEHLLYEVFQELTEPTPITAERLRAVHAATAANRGEMAAHR